MFLGYLISLTAHGPTQANSNLFFYVSFFCEVTNQMITACKSYITNNGTATIWDQPQDAVAEKLRAAIRLNEVGRASCGDFFHSKMTLNCLEL